MHRLVFVHSLARTKDRCERRNRVAKSADRSRLALEPLEDRIVPTNYTWNSSNDGNWASATNWTPNGIPGKNDNATFPATLTGAQTVALPAGIATSVSAVFLSEAGALTLAPGVGSTFVPRSITSTAAVSPLISTPLTLAAGSNRVVVSGPAPLTISGSIASSGPNKYGAGTLVLTGSNTYSGDYTLFGGILAVSSDGNLGSTDTDSTLTLQGTLEFTSSFTLDSHQTIATGATAGTIRAINGSDLTVNGADIAPFATITVATDTPTATVLTFNATQSFNGLLEIASGRVVFNAVPNVNVNEGEIHVDSGGQVEFGAAVTVLDSFRIAGSGPDGRGALVFDVDGVKFNASLGLTANATIGYVGPANGSTTFTLGVINSFTLTYGGFASSTAGSLIVSGSVGVTDSVNVLVGGTIGGNGPYGPVMASGTVDPGVPGTPVTLPTGALTFHDSGNNAGTLHIDIGSTASFDKVASTGAVDITGASLSLNVNAAGVSVGNTFTILTGTSITGAFNGLPSTGSTFAVGALTFSVTYGTSSVAVSLVSILAPVSLVSTVLNGGIAYVRSTLAGKQHSMVENVVYSFSQAVSLSAANFTLSGINGTTAAPNVVVSGSGTVWTVIFAGAGVNAATHSIGDGEYALVLSGVPNMSTDTFDFFRLLGDVDGDGTVSAADFSTLIGTFLRPMADPLYLGADDFDGDDTIGASDLSQFTANFLHAVPAPLPN